MIKETAGQMSRRSFTKKTTLGSVALGLGSMAPFSAKSYNRIIGANERVNMGVIGCGGMGNSHMSALLRMGDLNNVSVGYVCDVYDKRLAAAAEKMTATPIKNYKEILDNKDVDSILIATPEHWHHQMILDGLDAEKHIYCEKPMTHSIKESKEVIERMKTAKTKLQIGVQGMSDDSYSKANEYIRQDVLGDVVMAHIDYSRNYQGEDFWDYTVDFDAKPGVNIDWEAWLGPAKKRAYDPYRFFRWRKYWDYSGGIATDLFIHRISRIIRSIGFTFPDKVVASGGLWHYENAKGEIPDTFNMMIDYPEGVTVMVVSSMANDTSTKHMIRGSKATLEFTREGFVITPQTTGRESVKEEDLIKFRKRGAEDIVLHHKNLLDAIREDEPLKCDHNMAYYGVVACSMGVQSFRERSYLKWDNAKQRVVKA